MNKGSWKSNFKKVNLLSIVLLFVLILAGGVVRSTGSGMGCPDWPKCFGRYVPPASAAELPKDYKQKYVAKRLKKNERFAATLDVFGYNDLAKRIREDKSILVPEEFNVAKSWTEYINRLIGVISGFGLLFTTLYSISYWTDKRSITLLSIFNLVLVLLQGWLGSLVVSTNLVAWIVTVHMLLAMVILAVSIATYHLARTYLKPGLKIKAIIYIVTVVTLILSVVQITFGSEVREKIDAVAGRLEGYRESWVSNAGAIFTEHRDMAILVTIFNVLLFVLIRRNFNRHSIQQQLMSFTFLMIMLQIATGIMLSYWSLPPFAQTAHLILATLIFGSQFYLMLNLYKSVDGTVGYK